MTVVIEIPEEDAARVRAVAEAQGQDVPTFAVAAVLSAADTTDDDWDDELVTALQESKKDIRAGRLFTLEQVDTHVEEALADAKRRRHEQRAA